MSTKSSHTDHSGVIAPPPLIYLFFFVAGYRLNHLFPLGEFVPSVLRQAGKVLGGLSLFLVISGVVTMKRAGTSIDPYKATTRIVTRGPYRYSRNPMYLSLSLVYIGAALYLPLLWALATFPLAIIVIRFGVIDREERYLEARFGRQYLDYKQSTRRWL